MIRQSSYQNFAFETFLEKNRKVTAVVERTIRAEFVPIIVALFFAYILSTPAAESISEAVAKSEERIRVYWTSRDLFFYLALLNGSCSGKDLIDQ